MALSDYLTGNEWDACFYQYLKGGASLGDAMRTVIDAAIAAGYRFPGLTAEGAKMQQVCNGINAPKIRWLMTGGANPNDVFIALDNGREFMKQHLPAFVDETDEEWSQQMAAARGER